jgi:glycosyltransferase involved in cell wall biosynthesis
LKTILFGDHNSPHLYRWAGFLEEAGIDALTIGYGEAMPQDSYRYRRLIDRSAAVSTVTGKLVSFFKDLHVIVVEKPDYICVHFLTFRSSLLILLSPCPAILSCWGTDILVDQVAARGLKRIIRRKALAKSSWITCDAEEVRASVIREIPGSASKVKIIYWGVDTKLFCIPRPDQSINLKAVAIREELGIPDNAIVLLSNRLVAPNYRIEDIVRRFATHVSDSNTHLIVRIHRGADPAYAEAVKAEADKADTSARRRIHWLDRPMPFEEMPSLYSASDLVLHFPKSDATPVSMIEAFACGCGVLCSDSIEAYKALVEDYRLCRLPLEKLNDATVEEALAIRSRFAEANAAAVSRLHSKDITVRAIRALFHSTN